MYITNDLEIHTIDKLKVEINQSINGVYYQAKQ